MGVKPNFQKMRGVKLKYIKCSTYTQYRKLPFFVIEKFFVTETLDEKFSSETFSHLKFFFMEEFQNEILMKIFRNENFKSEI